jgi:hypothetical protein
MLTLVREPLHFAHGHEMLTSGARVHWKQHCGHILATPPNMRPTVRPQRPRLPRESME